MADEAELDAPDPGSSHTAMDDFVSMMKSMEADDVFGQGDVFGQAEKQADDVFGQGDVFGQAEKPETRRQKEEPATTVEELLRQKEELQDHLAVEFKNFNKQRQERGGEHGARMVGGVGANANTPSGCVSIAPRGAAFGGAPGVLRAPGR